MIFFIQVHDIFEMSDPEKLADPSDWLLAMLRQGSGVKLLLVESLALQTQMQAIVQSSNGELQREWETKITWIWFYSVSITGYNSKSKPNLSLLKLKIIALTRNLAKKSHANIPNKQLYNSFPTEPNNLHVSGKMRAGEDSTSPVARDGDFLLTFALRQILCTELKRNYSRVFVVRMTDAQAQGYVHLQRFTLFHYMVPITTLWYFPLADALPFFYFFHPRNTCP